MILLVNDTNSCMSHPSLLLPYLLRRRARMDLRIILRFMLHILLTLGLRISDFLLLAHILFFCLSQGYGIMYAIRMQFVYTNTVVNLVYVNWHPRDSARFCQPRL